MWVGVDDTDSRDEMVYEFLVEEVKPNDGRGGISVLETDLQVDFSPPVGYIEPTANSKIAIGEKSVVHCWGMFLY